MTQTQHRADHELERAITDELAWTPSVNAEEIGVTVTDGAATLSGNVGTYPELEEALRAATRVYGITVTADEIVVRHAADAPADADLAREAAIVFDRRTVVVPKGSVRVDVTDQVITLRGTVDWQFQREAARHAMAALPGVSGIRNLITLNTATLVPPAETQGRIKAALRRHAASDAPHVEVGVSGSHVTLSGTVSSSAERRAVEQTAWFAAGVTAVDNQVTLAG
ncbi:BON domain-containing protein [Amycolatopsis sp. NPDC051061]|uniref:BON domain-containing protein n=1 Tax=Amycolatopsis sp. NPDC051061 TaxID=3155042 RepID=UPI0034471C9F